MPNNYTKPGIVNKKALEVDGMNVDEIGTYFCYHNIQFIVRNTKISS